MTTFETPNGDLTSEDEIRERLVRRGIAQPTPKYDTAGRICKADGCRNTVPENDPTKLNLGLKDGYCGLLCLLEGRDREREYEGSR